MLKFYGYKGCGTCRKALKWLTSQGLEYDEVAIREVPPTIDEFEKALNSGYSLRALFNTSGMDYRAQGLKDVLPTLETADAIRLLVENGNLVKRPFLVFDGGVLVGFKEDEWSDQIVG